MKPMIYVLTVCGACIAAVVAAVRYLRLPPEYIWYTAALMAVVVAIAAIITFIRFLAAKKAQLAKANPKGNQDELDFHTRVREFAASVKHVTRHQRDTAPPRPRWLAARVDPPWVAVLGLQGHGKTLLLGGPHPKRLPEYDHNGAIKGADASAAPEDRPRLFSAPGTIAGYIPLDLFGGTLVAPVGDENLTTFNVPPFMYNGMEYSSLTVVGMT